MEMFEDELVIHRIITKSEGGGWFFHCPDCNYRARYWPDANNKNQRFELLNVGNPHARHTNSNIQEPEFDEDDWLTPELRRQIDEVFRRIGG